MPWKSTPMPDLDQEVANAMRHGWRVESRSNTTAVLVKGHRPNHVLHLLLSVFTVGVWLPVWVAIAVLGGEKRKQVAA